MRVRCRALGGARGRRGSLTFQELDFLLLLLLLVLLLIAVEWVGVRADRMFR